MLNAFVVARWIDGDCTMPVETMIEYVEKCIPECLKRYYA